jgi:hypothetical protein
MILNGVSEAAALTQMNDYGVFLIVQMNDIGKVVPATDTSRQLKMLASAASLTMMLLYLGPTLR